MRHATRQCHAAPLRLVRPPPGYALLSTHFRDDVDDRHPAVSVFHRGDGAEALRRHREVVGLREQLRRGEVSVADIADEDAVEVFGMTYYEQRAAELSGYKRFAENIDTELARAEQTGALQNGWDGDGHDDAPLDPMPPRFVEPPPGTRDTERNRREWQKLVQEFEDACVRLRAAGAHGTPEQQAESARNWYNVARRINAIDARDLLIANDDSAKLVALARKRIVATLEKTKTEGGGAGS